jgi:rRNA maturation protein Nop10
MSEALYLRCPSCGEEFRSRDQIPRESFEGVAVEGSEEKCPSCGAMVAPAVPNAYFRDE